MEYSKVEYRAGEKQSVRLEGNEGYKRKLESTKETREHNRISKESIRDEVYVSYIF